MTANRPFTWPDVRHHGGACAPTVAPPLNFGAAGMLLRAASVPLSVSAQPQAPTVAAFLLVSGTALDVAGVIEVVRHQTTIVPHHAVSALFITCPDRIVRNPMYTALAIPYLGCALLTVPWRPVATLPIAPS